MEILNMAIQMEAAEGYNIMSESIKISQNNRFYFIFIWGGVSWLFGI
jgi:hypothetical protein